MEASIVEQVESWESEPFSGGYGGLHDLADREFTGAIATGDTYLFMLNGRAIGVFELPPVGSPEGALGVFEDASGTAYEAPHPSLPLLFTMYLSDGDERGKYYTEDTDLEEVDQRLSEGGFTGYIELSENVLSGDYYVVYQAGRSMSAAFVGASGRLYTDEEAFERAADEVGIYRVISVDIDVLDIPSPADETGAGAAAAGATAGATTPADHEESAPEPAPEPTLEPTDDTEESSPAEPSPDTGSEPSTEAGTDGATEAGEPVDAAEPTADEEEAAPGDVSAAETAAEPPSEPSTESSTESSTETDVGAPPEMSTESDAGATSTAPVDADTSADRAEPGDVGDSGPSVAQADATPRETEVPPGGTSRGGDGDLAVRSVPSLDPERSGDGTTTAGGGQLRGIDARDRRSLSQSGSESGTAASTTAAEPEPEPEPERASEEVESLRSELSRREARIEELEAELAEASDQHAELRAERDRLREERDELEATVQQLRERVERLESRETGAGSAGGAGEALTPHEALAGTDLFVRYRSKSEPTLEALADGVQQSDVTSNLQLERHTRFDDATATVDGQSYDAFLGDTLAYRFVRWAIEDLGFEIRDTGHTASLSDLYEVLPLVDRAELQGTVSVETEEGTAERSFDVVLRDRMGDPLVVANLDTSRQPTGRSPMRSLIEDATTVAEGSENLSAAFFVTSSFFESDALETARDETGTGLLSRDKRKSVVKLSRKRGYHLCLVEARDESFHLTVPEL